MKFQADVADPKTGNEYTKFVLGNDETSVRNSLSDDGLYISRLVVISKTEQDRCDKCECILNYDEEIFTDGQKFICLKCHNKIVTINNFITKQNDTPGLKWRGTMVCAICGHNWHSRRDTPPVRCPACNKTDIVPIKEARGCLTMILLFMLPTAWFCVHHFV